jgi:hypothetical protein
MIDETTNEELVICQIILIARPKVSLTSQTPEEYAPVLYTEQKATQSTLIGFENSQIDLV